MNLKIYFLLISFITFFSLFPLSYDIAIHKAQNGDIQAADEQMRRIIVDSPDNPEILHDAGIIAYKKNDMNEAIAYFSRAAQCSAENKDICFRSYFNAGNASVAHKDLKKALDFYDQALAIEPTNENARHNREVVAQMLRDQQKNEQQKNNSQDQKNNENNQEKENDPKESSNQNPQQDDNNDNDQSSSDQNEIENQSDKKSQRKQKENAGQDRESKQGKQERNNQDQHQNDRQDKKRNGDQEFDEKSKNTQNQRKKHESEQHEKSPEKQTNNNNSSIPSDNTQEQDKTSGTGKALGDQKENMHGDIDEKTKGQGVDQKIDDPWLLGILENQESRDKSINKKLMEARIHQHGGKNDQNGW